MIMKEKSFYGLSIAPGILQALAKLKFTEPTPIQEQSIPVAIEGKDLMGIAQTGTGKTLAFGIPMIQRILQSKGVGLIVLPTRELALQVNESLHKIGGTLGIKTAVLIGGAYIGRQIKEISKRPNIIIGTPGRIIDHLKRGTLRLDQVKILVLDEATSALDVESEAIIQRNMRAICQGRTVIVIAHRLSAVRQANAIVVMDKGRIVEAGSHEQLVAQSGGIYARLWAMQSGGGV